jgi:hypothetical protein
MPPAAAAAAAAGGLLGVGKVRGGVKTELFGEVWVMSM